MKVIDDILDGLENAETVTEIDWETGKLKYSKRPPNAEEIETAVIQELRRRAYPDWRVFADAVYHAEKGDRSKMNEYISKVDEIKTRFKKDEQADILPAR